jgi:hypothetical protein
MRSRIVWLLVGVLVGAVIGGVTVAYLTAPPHPRINPGQYERIREGMTLADVNLIIGGPPGDYHPGNLGTRVRVIDGRDDFGEDLRLTQMYWSGAEYEIGVLLDRDGIVVARQLTEIASPRQPSWLERLRQTLGW